MQWIKEAASGYEAWHADAGSLRLRLHTYECSADNTTRWVGVCRPIGLFKVDLGAISLADAKEFLVELVRNRLTRTLKELG